MASAFVDEALQGMELLGRDFVRQYEHPLTELQIGLRHVRTFLLFARKWQKDVRFKSDESTTTNSSLIMESLLKRLEDSLIENGKSFHNLCLTQKNELRRWNWWTCDLYKAAKRLAECIYSFRPEIVKSYITLSDYYPLQSRDQSLEFVDSLQVNMADIRNRFTFDEDPKEVEYLREKLQFFKNFIRFAQLRGFEHCQLQFLFNHLRVVAVNAARLCYEWMLRPSRVAECWSNEFQPKFSKLLLKIKPLDPQIRETYVQVLRIARSSHTLTLRTDRYVLGDFVDSLRYNILEALADRDSYIVSLKDQVAMLYEGLIFLRAILTNHLEKIDKLREKVKNLIGAAVNEAAILICSLPVHELEEGLTMEMDFALFNFLEKIKLIKAITSAFIFNNEHGFVEFFLENLKELPSCKTDSIAYAKAQIQRVQEGQNVAKTCSPLPSQGSTQTINKMEVLLDDEADMIIGEIIRGPKKLDIISIVGMPGIGKTTLARSVYDDLSVSGHFYARAWCVISQVYEKKDLLRQILWSVDLDFSYDNYLEKNEYELEEKLKKCLLKRRYLIVLDDVWDIDAWSDLVRSFPDDANSSRILLTSRQYDVVKKINPTREPHPLRLLSDEESWHLLQKKLSCKKSYPLDLGKKIAKNCKGLPLTIVIVAGILADLEQDVWPKIAERLSLSDRPTIDQCMNMLEMSYKTLPENLRSCFLYFGAFREDEEIPCKRLIWLWKAEGFVEECEAKSIDDVAKDYLNDLIGRNLVMVSKERSIGGAKTCRIHDLLHKFCVVKAKKEKFVSILSGHDELFIFYGQRLCIHSTSKDFEMTRLFCPSARSLLFADDGNYHFNHRHISFIFHFFKLLKVLNLTSINLGNTFPSEIALLVELRYLAIRGHSISIPPVIANLSDLETLLVYAHRVYMPVTIWNLPKLRVLRSNSIIYLDSGLMPSNVHNLDTFSTLKVSYWQLEKIMRKLPNIHKLKCKLFVKSGESSADCKSIVVMDWLSRLASLHLILDGMKMHHIGFCFPLNIKKLSLSGCHSSIIPKGGELPNLVVLKLYNIYFEGDIWDMNEEWEFPKLKLLEMKFSNIVSWTGSNDVDHFPCLEKLVVQYLGKLKRIPTCLGDISTLQMIEVRYCRNFVASLFQKIKEEQNNWGNYIQVLTENVMEDESSEDREDESSKDAEDELRVEGVSSEDKGRTNQVKKRRMNYG